MYRDSTFLRCAKAVMSKELYAELNQHISPLSHNLNESIERQSGKKIDLIHFYRWYTSNVELLSNKNRGAFNVSPMACASDAIADYLEFIVEEQIPSCNIGSYDWFKFLDRLAQEYHISLDGTEVSVITYDTNYEHKPVTALKGLLNK
jgi:hypothetical protein